MLILAHRGFSAEYTENTIQAFKKAFDTTADGIEFDVQLSKDGIPVIFHDFSLKRLTNIKANLSELTLSELQKIKFKNEETVPKLSTLLKIIPKNKIINLELKGKNTAKPVYEILSDFIKNNKLKKQNIIVSSFNHKELKTFQKINTQNIEIGVIISAIPIGGIKFAKRIGAKYINPSIRFLDKNFVKKASKNDIKIIAWTVNTQKDFIKAKSLGIYGIFTDYPDKFKNL